MRDLLPKYRINFAFDESKMKHDLTTKCKLSEAIEIEIFQNAEPSINCTARGIVIDLREEQEENEFDSTRVNSEFVSNEIDESDLQSEKHDEQRI
jgi:hypothetical protein